MWRNLRWRPFWRSNWMSRQVQQRALNCTVTSCLSLFSSFFLSFLPTISACAKKKKIIFKGLFLQHDFNVVIHRYGKSLKPVGLACYRLTQTLTDDVSEERHGDVAIISTVVANREHTRTRHRNRVCRSKKKKKKEQSKLFRIFIPLSVFELHR